MTRIVWHVEKRNISQLKPYSKNPRLITKEGLDDLRKSFDEIGMAQPININLDNTILSGHARYQQLKSENPSQVVDVYVPNRQLTPKEEEAVIIRMNKNVAGKWDFETLANEFELPDLVEWGFDASELDIDKLSGIDPKNTEIDTENFGSDLEHTCPKCGFEFND
mgnify:CR=1 FL=1